MQDAAKAELFLSEDVLGTLRGEIADTHQPFRLKNANELTQVFVAHCKQGGAFCVQQFVRGTVPSAMLEESQWAIVHDEMFVEKLLRVAESFGEESP
jgi:hypothetical protein